MRAKIPIRPARRNGVPVTPPPEPGPADPPAPDDPPAATREDWEAVVAELQRLHRLPGYDARALAEVGYRMIHARVRTRALFARLAAGDFDALEELVEGTPILQHLSWVTREFCHEQRDEWAERLKGDRRLEARVDGQARELAFLRAELARLKRSLAAAGRT